MRQCETNRWYLGFTVIFSDLDSVTLKVHKVKDCGHNLGSDNWIEMPGGKSYFQYLG